MFLVYKIFFTLCLCFLASTKQINKPDQENVKREGKTPYAIYNECGGYIEAKLDETIILEYKPDEEYDNDELCVWVIRNGECNGALFTKTKSGFEVGHDYLQISGFPNTDARPPFNHVLGNTNGLEQASARAYVNFVVFSSDYSNTGTGFRLEIVGYESRSNRKVYEDFLTNEPIGTMTLRPYVHNMAQLYLIQPTFKTVQSLALEISVVTESCCDYVSVYSMERNGQLINFRQHESRLRGNGTGWYETEYYTNFIVFFTSDGSVIPEAAGIDLIWHVPDSATTESTA